MFDGLIDWLKEQLIESIIEFLNSQNNSINIISDSLSQNAVEYSPSAFETVLQIAENVMLPIAGVVLTYVAVHEIVSMVVNNNNMHEHTTWDIMKWIFKTSITIFLVSNSFTIVSAVIEVGSQLVIQATPYANNIIANESQLSIEASLMEMSITELTMITLSAFFHRLIFYILRLLIQLFIIGRIIEIYMYLSVAPIPMSTFGNREISDTGINYTKNIIALALQGVIILIAISIYNALSITFTQRNTLSGDASQIVGGIFESLTLIGALALMVVKSKSIANSIINAR